MGMNLMYESPSHRRDFLDAILCQVFPEYLKILQGYTLVLKQRNSLLKAIREGKAQSSQLVFWNQKYIAGNKKIYEYRHKITQFYAEHISSLRGYFFGKIENIEFCYSSKCEGKTPEEKVQSLEDYISVHHQKEILA